MDICERIVKARNTGLSIVRIVHDAVNSVDEAALRLGLWAGSADEIPREQARRVLRAVLVEDMAYNDPIVPLLEAIDLADTFLGAFGDDARYFTNATWRKPREGGPIGSLEMGSWFPATPSTFDSGILVLAPDRFGCAWFMDED